VTFYTNNRVTAKPDLEIPYRFGRIRFWHAADILVMPPASEAPKAIDEDEATDD
jgi:hypothetical protein